MGLVVSLPQIAPLVVTGWGMACVQMDTHINNAPDHIL
jgi:hypothetical protein